MRIHNNKIVRRINSNNYSDYKLYEQNLREDFNYECGYCGKIELITSKGFEIDHFVPQRLDKSRETDYDNLVYACFNCNRKKGGKFPTEDKNNCVVGNIGIIDPTSDEFDKHIERDKDGNIVGITELGKYICKEIFKFDRRPMRQIWKAMQIIEKKKMLREKIKKGEISKELIEFYAEIDENLEDLIKLFFNKRE